MNNVNEFDFTKNHQKILNKLNKQSYGKLAFLMLGLSALGFSGYIASDVISDKFKDGEVIAQQENKLLIKHIKAMNESEFTNMLEYISANVSIYDKKVNLIQEAIVNTYKEKGFRISMSTESAEKLGFLLTEYKEKTKEDIANLNKVRISVDNNVEVSTTDVKMFLTYMSAYKAKEPLNYAPIDNKIHTIMSSNDRGNMEYNKDNHIQEQIKSINAEIKEFRFFSHPIIIDGTTKPKM